MSRVLIVSDGRAGHLQQSVAFARYLDMPYDIVEVSPRFKGAKAFALLLDRAGIYIPALFKTKPYDHNASYTYVAGAGSGTYYMVKYLARRTGTKSVAMMLPKGFVPNFDLIFAQVHDDPPRKPNIKPLPANLSFTEPSGIFKPDRMPVVGVIIGGENAHFHMSVGMMRAYLDEIVQRYGKSHMLAVTTSPRTSREIESLVASYPFDYTVIYSKEPKNPIPDFLEHCETVFITEDSTSMISQAVSYGKSHVVVLPLETDNKEGKHRRFVEMLEREGYLHVFDGSMKHCNRKIDFRSLLKKVLK